MQKLKGLVLLLALQGVIVANNDSLSEEQSVVFGDNGPEEEFEVLSSVNPLKYADFLIQDGQKRYKVYRQQYIDISSKWLAYRRKNELLQLYRQIKDYVSGFDDQREIVALLAQRTLPDFQKEYKETLVANFQRTGLDPKKIYDSLGVSAQATLQQIKKLLKEKEVGAQQDNNSEELFKLRQIGFLFRNAVSRQHYDAYLNNTLHQLQLSGEKLVEITNKQFELTTVKAILEELLSDVRNDLKKNYGVDA